jgi:UDP-N-acetylglucosamine enolpyruvyl transferase
MGPKEGNSVVKHGVLDERLNVHGVKNLKVSDLSVCPDNVGCNTFSVSRHAFTETNLTTSRLPSSSVRSALSLLLRIWATVVMLWR